MAVRVMKLQRTSVSVDDLADGQCWRVPYYLLNLQHVGKRLPDTTDRPELSRQALSVGDGVGFVDKYGVEPGLFSAKSVAGSFGYKSYG